MYDVGFCQDAAYVPDESREVFAEILREYQEGELTPGGKPQRRAFVDPIESIRAARLETFWTDDELPPPGRQMWWEVWCVRALEDELERLIAKDRDNAWQRCRWTPPSTFDPCDDSAAPRWQA